jgi:hypothetical protein
MSIVSSGIRMLVCLGFIWLLADCTVVPPAPVFPTTHYVRIGTVVSPLDLTVRVGDEIRWVNLTAAPVMLFLDFDRLSLTCQNGFHRSTMAKIQPDDYVSLCLARPGLFGYAVRSAGPVSGVFHTAVIRVKGDQTPRL